MKKLGILVLLFSFPSFGQKNNEDKVFVVNIKKMFTVLEFKSLKDLVREFSVWKFDDHISVDNIERMITLDGKSLCTEETFFLNQQDGAIFTCNSIGPSIIKYRLPLRKIKPTKGSFRLVVPKHNL